jgi:hypothetical protein
VIAINRRGTGGRGEHSATERKKKEKKEKKERRDVDMTRMGTTSPSSPLSSGDSLPLIEQTAPSSEEMPTGAAAVVAMPVAWAWAWVGVGSVVVGALAVAGVFLWLLLGGGWQSSSPSSDEAMVGALAGLAVVLFVLLVSVAAAWAVWMRRIRSLLAAVRVAAREVPVGGGGGQHHAPCLEHMAEITKRLEELDERESSLRRSMAAFESLRRRLSEDVERTARAQAQAQPK